MSAPPIDRPTLEWVDPDGAVWPLGEWDKHQLALTGLKGLGLTARTITADASPYGGTVVRHIQPTAKTITLPIYVEGASHSEFIARWRTLGESFARTRWAGPGAIRVTRPDGTARQTPAYYADGWDHDPDANATQDTAVVSLTCPSPYWVDRDDTLDIAVRVSPPDLRDYFDSYPAVSNSQAFGEVAVNNPGSAHSWPEWTIVGPTSLVEFANTTTGESFTFDPATYGGLTAGQVATITTYPAMVRGPGGDVWTGALNWPFAQLWALAPGPQTVRVDAADAGPTTRVTGVHHPQYETA